MAVSLQSTFECFRDHIDDHNDRRERLVKISRYANSQSVMFDILSDITALSKKIIFSLHRIAITQTENPPKEVLEQMRKREEEIQVLFQKAIPDLCGSNTWRYHRQISPALQEWIEAMTFKSYILNSRIPTLEELQSLIPRIAVSNSDYLLGLGDLTGELMRRAINNVSLPGGPVETKRIAGVLRYIQSEMEGLSLGFVIKDFSQKIETLRSSTAKVEDAVYSATLRPEGFGVEYIPAEEQSTHRRE
ncbi:Translin-associated protein X [Neolecta irregularis DAH-3]|uniref:Translin-associated protein X n=1 Tax=Neolecta irregularis (strain DAH-3) TaxID=1198029 RepID=A0A1U7LR23_NEOID|nr:Translin-associated protein X [Neolecta irregularis DAH-3]|eukprot:OLL25002.1 Translin-associated protein X [Neolecta irregularis DAH-3]